MKKRTLSTLLLAGVMAATMVPTAVFAATTTKTDTTTVGYTAGGVVSPDGTVMLSVPKAVEFMNNQDVDGFDVKAFVWGYDADGNGGWQTPGTLKPDGTNKYELGTGVAIGVSVASTYGYKLQRSEDDVRGAGAYTYTLDKQADGTEQALVLDGTNNGSTAAAEVSIGTLKDDAASPRYTIEGTVKMTKTPIAGQNEPATRFSDTLTYKFANLPQVTQG